MLPYGKGHGKHHEIHNKLTNAGYALASELRKTSPSKLHSVVGPEGVIKIDSALENQK